MEYRQEHAEAQFEQQLQDEQQQLIWVEQLSLQNVISLLISYVTEIWLF